jgi:hypothetical protein
MTSEDVTKQLKAALDECSRLREENKKLRRFWPSRKKNPSAKGKIIGVRMSLTEEGNEDPWTLPPSGRKVEKTIQGSFPEKVSIVVGNMVYIEKSGLPAGN